MIKIRYSCKQRPKGGGVHNLFVLTWCYPAVFFSKKQGVSFRLVFWGLLPNLETSAGGVSWMRSALQKLWFCDFDRKELRSRVFFQCFWWVSNLIFALSCSRIQETDTSALETQNGCFPEFHLNPPTTTTPNKSVSIPLFSTPIFVVASWSFVESPRPGSLKAIAQVLFAPEQAKQAMAERKTEVFGQFATLHPEARVGRSLRRFLRFGLKMRVNKKRWALE